MWCSLSHTYTHSQVLCMNVVACKLQHACRGRRIASGVGPHHPSYLEQSLVYHGKHQASWPLRTWGFSCLSRPALSRHNEITVPGPVWILGIQTQDLTSTQQVFYALSHFSSPEKSPLWGTICAKYLAQGLSVVGPRVHGSCHCPRCPEASTRNT